MMFANDANVLESRSSMPRVTEEEKLTVTEMFQNIQKMQGENTVTTELALKIFAVFVL